MVFSLIHRVCNPNLKTIINFSKAKPLFECFEQSHLQKFRVQNFHTTPKRAFHPVLLIFGKQAAKFIAILTGRGFRKWWKNLPKDKQYYFKETVKRNRLKLFGFTAVSSVLFLVYYESHVEETPITGRRRFIAFTPSQFEKISEFEYELQMEMYKNEILPIDVPDWKKVEKVANRILAGNKDLKEIYDKSWSITVVKNSEQNAFVLPNGHIFVLTGMLEVCDTDDKLGVVLAHEMAHSILGHGAELVSYTHIFDFVVIAAIAALWAVLPSDAIAIFSQWLFHKVTQILLDLPYSRKLETEADEVGLQLAAKSCFDVRECSAFWSRMAILDKSQLGADFDWLSTHPNHETRSASIDSSMEKALKVRQECGCPKLPDLDPRVTVSMLKQKVAEEQTKSIILQIP